MMIELSIQLRDSGDLDELKETVRQLDRRGSYDGALECLSLATEADGGPRFVYEQAMTWLNVAREGRKVCLSSGITFNPRLAIASINAFQLLTGKPPAERIVNPVFGYVEALRVWRPATWLEWLIERLMADGPDAPVFRSHSVNGKAQFIRFWRYELIIQRDGGVSAEKYCPRLPKAP